MRNASGKLPLMEIHELIGAGIREARERKGWRQEDAAREFQRHGLTTWRRTTVADVEAGRRHPSIGDLLLVALALDVTLADLIPDNAERVEVGNGASFTAPAVRALLSGDREALDELPVDDYPHIPGDKMDRAIEAADRIAELYEQLASLPKLGQQIAEIEKSLRLNVLPIKGPSWLERIGPPTEAETRAASRLGVDPYLVQLASLGLWDRSFEAERDARVSVIADEPASAIARRRGHATRAMLSQLQAYLDTTDQQQEGDTEPNADDQGD